ncbi:type VI secretion system baseplate subunit TssG [Acetobacter sp. DsW_063]|uniref:type VI secretion system baseplate subunit TssG n=1 Tax=Acetobacter sp. DsW_063 TaxID=1514894 RepID=UPI000B64154B|nr:type VI secretion system baseplate subunit TssG [Acetobacter sp. DsW_063]OUJ16201.1 hypothetical protein HK28_03010 [Acetobacter sp. DsW_063]
MNDGTPDIARASADTAPAPAVTPGIERRDDQTPVGVRTLAGSLLAQVLEEPARFSFDAAVEIIRRAHASRDVSDAVQFKTPPGLATPASDVLSVKARGDGRHDVTTAFSGLTGHGGTMPRPYTALVDEEHRKRSPALSAFMEVLAQRGMAQFAEAGAKYHPHRQHEDPRLRPEKSAFARALFALTGYESDRDRQRLAISPLQLLYFSGTFASWPRSSERLASLLREWLATNVQIEQFSGVWRTLDPDQQSALPAPGRDGQFSQLGVDAAIGQQTWDVNTRINIVIGPLSYTDFESLLPDKKRLQEALGVVAAYLDDQAEAAVTLSVKSNDVPDARIGEARLGWTSWLGISGGREDDVFDVVFDSAALAAAQA